ncbi:hypothetical protein D3C80_1840530 [compost metagenome]
MIDWHQTRTEDAYPLHARYHRPTRSIAEPTTAMKRVAPVTNAQASAATLVDRYIASLARECCP